MRANKYQRLALKTALLDRSMEDQLLNSILGLCGESGELCEIIKNGGDSLTARYIELMVQVGELGDTIKKNIFHGHPVDKVKLMKLSRDIAELASEIDAYIVYRDIEFHMDVMIDDDTVVRVAEELVDAQWYISLGVYSIGKKLADIMNGNIAKLFKRFGEKFSFERSINRDA